MKKTTKDKGKVIRTMEHRTEKITFRVTPTELKYIENKLIGTNYKMSEFVRAAVLDKEVVIIEGIKAMAMELRAIGRNLNQLTILSHKGLIETVSLEITKNKLDNLWKIANLLIKKASKK